MVAPAHARRLVRLTFSCTCLVSLTQSTAAAAAPAAAEVFSRLDLTAWVVGAYLLTATVAGPLAGAVADRHDRVLALRVSLAGFAVTGVCCALAPTMGWLVAARALQGLAGGALITLAATSAAQALSAEDRPGYQGRLTSVTSGLTVVGPVLAGAVLVATGWPAVFLVTAAAAAGLAGLTLRPLVTDAAADGADSTAAGTGRPPAATPDLVGALLLVAGSSLVVGGMQVAVRGGAGASRWFAGGAAAVVGLGLLLRLYRHSVRVPSPLVPVDLLRDPGFAGCVVQNAFGGAVLFGVPVQVQQYLQAGTGTSPVLSGLALVPLFGTLALVSAGFARWGRPARRPSVAARLVTVAAATTVAGLGLLALVPLVSGQWLLLTGMVVLGAGLGLHLPAVGVLGQAVAPRPRLGAAMAMLMLARTLGGAWSALATGAAVAAATAAGVGAGSLLAGLPMIVALGGWAVRLATRCRPTDPVPRGRHREVTRSAAGRTMEW